MQRISFNEITGLKIIWRLEFLGNSHGETIIRIFLVIGRFRLPVLLFKKQFSYASVLPSAFVTSSCLRLQHTWHVPKHSTRLQVRSVLRTLEFLFRWLRRHDNRLKDESPSDFAPFVCARAEYKHKLCIGAWRRLNRLFQIALLSRLLCLCFAL